MGLAAWGPAERAEAPVRALKVASGGAPAPGAPEATPGAATDTLRYSVRAGDPLIVALPAAEGGREVTYRLVDAPALSWLVDRSFMWRTTEQERGTLPILIERMPSRERLVLMVTLEG